MLSQWFVSTLKKTKTALRLHNWYLHLYFFVDIYFWQQRGRHLVVRSALFSRRRVSSESTSTKDDVIVDFEDPDLPLPEYPKRPDEPLETRKQR